jgi:LigD, primase-polymerase domain
MTGSKKQSPPNRRRSLVAQSERKKAHDGQDKVACSVAGIRISHPDRLIYPDLGISKIQLARYYDGIADWVVPHVAGRPLTLVHCPAGLGAPCIYLKHAKAWGPSALRRVKIQEKTKVGEYLVVGRVLGGRSASIGWLVQSHPSALTPTLGTNHHASCKREGCCFPPVGND